ncbi:hypothetical protein [Paenibacillus aestuarii]|uniref:Uncharacterized protein n=1 Tax=Paenibacillus aestuarii TaxID=516965 RepID=A0ABW0K142_9BACL|nr:hypothetical protein [Paenibacillus aestuarii]
MKADSRAVIGQNRTAAVAAPMARHSLPRRQEIMLQLGKIGLPDTGASRKST